MTEASTGEKRAVTTAAATASTAAVACGVCCVLPFALPAALLGTFGPVFAFFERAFPWMTDLAVLAVLAGWSWVLWQSWRSRRRPAASTVIVMATATAATGVALAWPSFEGPLIRLLTSGA